MECVCASLLPHKSCSGVPARGSVCLLVDDTDMQHTMARLPAGAHASAVRWSPDGGLLAAAVGGSPPRGSSAAGRDAATASAHLASRGSGTGQTPGSVLTRDLLEGKAAVLLFSASGVGHNPAAHGCPLSVRPAHVLLVGPQALACGSDVRVPHQSACVLSAGQPKQRPVALHHDAASFLACTVGKWQATVHGMRQVSCSMRCACLPPG